MPLTLLLIKDITGNLRIDYVKSCQGAFRPSIEADKKDTMNLYQCSGTFIMTVLL